MESPLEVLSRAVCMLQENANESRLTTKELPTTKWRRDRRIRATEYQLTSPSILNQSENHQISQISSSQVTTKPLSESTNTTNVASTMVTSTTVASSISSLESPIDMSVTSTTMKPRSPPPPYREPLPGSTYSLVAAAARPSVITQAPPKRSNVTQDASISNRENNLTNESISMCDPVIDEHFRRSLGADYMALFNNKKTSPSKGLPTSSAKLSQPEKCKTNKIKAISPVKQETQLSRKLETAPPSSPQPHNNITTNNNLSSNSTSVAHSVDDHFAKALGDTWKKLQAADKVAK